MFDSSAEMADALTAVVDADTAALDADGLLDQLSTIQQLESVLAAKKAEKMVAFHLVLSGTSADLGHEGPRPGDRPAGPAERRWSADVLRSVSDEIGLALGAHRKTAARWLNGAALLVDRFPATLELLGRGGIPAAAAQHVARQLAVIVDDELRAAVEQIVLAWGKRYGWAKIKKIANREAQKVLAEYESLLHAQRQDERATYTVNHDGGMADLVVSTSAIDITAIMAALTTRARDLQRDGDPRNLDQLRTDLAVNRLLGNDQTTSGSSRSEPDPKSHADATLATDPDPKSRADATPDPDPEPAHGNRPRTASAEGSQAATGDQPAATETTSGDVPTRDTKTNSSAAATTPSVETSSDPESVPAADGTSWDLDNPHAAATSHTESTSDTVATPHTQSTSDELTTFGSVTTSDAESASRAVITSDAATDSATDADSGAGMVRGAETAAGVVGPVGGSVPPESGLNPAVGVQVVIHCSYAEAEALATGAICTGGELEGYGPLPQDALAMAFTRAKFRYRLTDREPKSDPARYTPSPGLDQHVRDRDQRCRFPGCNARVEYCDLDHRIPFPEGRTDADNLEPFCRHHHRLKHHGDWQVFTTDTGTLVFISPTGRAYLDPPTMPGMPGVESRPDTGTREAESRPDTTSDTGIREAESRPDAA